jgi:predicted DNA-binding transcriptional regulator AlpA
MDDLDSVRVLTKPQVLQVTSLNGRTWERLEARGETPPKTQLSDNRVGYRVVDVARWLDARRRDSQWSNEQAAQRAIDAGARRQENAQRARRSKRNHPNRDDGAAV